MNSVLVLIPCHNNKEGVLKSLESIGREEQADVLVVDDGSQPELPHEELIEAFRGRGQLYLLRFPSNKGIVTALNAGARYASDQGYKYIARLDAGDENRPDRLSLQQNFLEANPGYVIVGGWVEFVTPKGERLFTLKHPIEDGEIRQAIYRYNPFVHPAVMMRTKALIEIGGYPDGYPALEDWACFLELAAVGQMANLPRVLLSYEVSPTSISTKKRFTQSRSKVALLAHHFRWNTNQVRGLVRNVILMLFPRAILTWLKKVLKGRRERSQANIGHGGNQ
ncbi:glycosyltransferase [Marinobacteraceae bacterium S3BR75-40.1]